MKPTEILSEEHKLITRFIKALTTAARRLEQNQQVQPDFFIEAASFIKAYADDYHCQKEESVLFPAMIAHGMPAGSGPIKAMLNDHGQGRIIARAMGLAAERLKNGEEGQRMEVVYLALGYADLLHDHISKEDRVLFPLADRVIPPLRYADLAESAALFGRDGAGAVGHERYLAMVEKLENEMDIR